MLIMGNSCYLWWNIFMVNAIKFRCVLLDRVIFTSTVTLPLHYANFQISRLLQRKWKLFLWWCWVKCNLLWISYNPYVYTHAHTNLYRYICVCIYVNLKRIVKVKMPQLFWVLILNSNTDEIMQGNKSGYLVRKSSKQNILALNGVISETWSSFLFERSNVHNEI